MAADAQVSDPAPHQLGSGARASRTPLPLFLLLVVLVSAFNMGDRLLIGIVAEPIKREFGLTDAMMGLLGGTTFALVYPPLGLPIARLADRSNRRNILAWCLGIWSLATAAGGMVTGYWQLAASRLGVAAGEAGFVPPTHALISDYVSEARRARAFSTIAAGAALGSLMANIAGGVLTDHYGWRAAFLSLGIGGLVLAVLVRLLIREPARVAKSAPGTPRPSALGRIVRNRAIMLCIAGSALHLMYQYAVATWAAPFYVRTFHLSLFQAGVLIGAGGALATLLGGVAGGFVGDWFAARDRRWLAFWPGLTVALGAPFGAIGFLAGDIHFVFASLMIATFLNALYQSSTYALVQAEVGGESRATAAAFMIFVQNLVGLGLGPLLVGVLSDRLTAGGLGDHGLAVALAAANILNLLGAALFFASGLATPRQPKSPGSQT